MDRLSGSMPHHRPWCSQNSACDRVPPRPAPRQASTSLRPYRAILSGPHATAAANVPPAPSSARASQPSVCPAPAALSPRAGHYRGREAAPSEERESQTHRGPEPACATPSPVATRLALREWPKPEFAPHSEIQDRDEWSAAILPVARQAPAP